MSTHFVGVGGAGMSGIARVLVQRGEQVTGCDRSLSPLLKRLAQDGITCHVGHDPSHLDGCDRVIVSGAIPDDTPELERAVRPGYERLSPDGAAHWPVIVDKTLRRGLVLSDGSLLPFFTRPISALLALVVLAMLLSQVPAVRRLIARRAPAAAA